jgi:hypothetical protein
MIDQTMVIARKALQSTSSGRNGSFCPPVKCIHNRHTHDVPCRQKESQMTPVRMDADVEVADEQDVNVAISRALERAGVSLDELRQQAMGSHFSSERARMAWFMISPFVARP